MLMLLILTCERRADDCREGSNRLILKLEFVSDDEVVDGVDMINTIWN